MIDFYEDNGNFFLTLGWSELRQEPTILIPVSHEEAVEIARTFTEEWADNIANSDEIWIFNDFKVTNAPDHPYAWTDFNERVILYFKEQRWHMTQSEIAEIGRLAKRVINFNA